METLPDGCQAEGELVMRTTTCAVCNAPVPSEAMKGDQCRECRLKLGSDRGGREKFRKVSGYERIIDKYKGRRTEAEFKQCEEIAKELTCSPSE